MGSFGSREFEQWRGSKPELTRELLFMDLDNKEWHDLFYGFQIPMRSICERFFFGDLEGARAAGARLADEEAMSTRGGISSRQGSSDWARAVMDHLFRNLRFHLLIDGEKRPMVRIPGDVRHSKYVSAYIEGFLERAIDISKNGHDPLESASEAWNGEPSPPDEPTSLDEGSLLSSMEANLDVHGYERGIPEGCKGMTSFKMILP
jgi:hypothetical protein